MNCGHPDYNGPVDGSGLNGNLSLHGIDFSERKIEVQGSVPARAEKRCTPNPKLVPNSGRHLCEVLLERHDTNRREVISVRLLLHAVAATTDFEW